MILEPMADSDTKEDKVVVGIVKFNPKQRATIGKGKGKQCAPSCKGKQRNQGKRGQSDREPRLQIIVDSPADDAFLKSNLAMTVTMTGPFLTLIPTLLMTSMSRVRI